MEHAFPRLLLPGREGPNTGHPGTFSRPHSKRRGAGVLFAALAERLGGGLRKRHGLGHCRVRNASALLKVQTLPWAPRGRTELLLPFPS